MTISLTHLKAAAETLLEEQRLQPFGNNVRAQIELRELLSDPKITITLVEALQIAREALEYFKWHKNVKVALAEISKRVAP